MDDSKCPRNSCPKANWNKAHSAAKGPARVLHPEGDYMEYHPRPRKPVRNNTQLAGTQRTIPLT